MTKPALRTDAEFAAFYERHWKYLYRLCYTYMKSEADAEDCAEDVFVKVLTGDYSFTDETHERKWLTVTAINLCKDRLRHASRKQVLSIDDENAPEIASPEEEDHKEVLTAVLNLPPKLKDVIWLYYFEEYSTDEIAKILKRPPSTVRNQMKDARTRLKFLLEGSEQNA